MAEGKYNKENVIRLMIEKQADLSKKGISRLPQRSDFTSAEIVAVKSYLGPWPRALEAAGLKPPRADSVKEKNKEKRIRAKRNRTKAKKEMQTKNNKTL